MEQAAAAEFVADWVARWNARDLGGLLRHFSDDVVFTSPLAARLLGGNGIVRGKQALSEYWSEGLRRTPDLHFAVRDHYVGVDSLVINYTNQNGHSVCEVLVFDGDQVVGGHATYSPNPPERRQ